MYTLLDSCAQTSGVHRPLRTDLQNTVAYFSSHTPAAPMFGRYVPAALAVVALALRKVPPGSTHNNTIYVAAVRPTGCCSQDL